STAARRSTPLMRMEISRFMRTSAEENRNYRRAATIAKGHGDDKAITGGAKLSTFSPQQDERPL
ncbi:MAG TPA: hypothetical protein VNK82_01785, partial [Terriglobales bacterium]|nr:hypothetical protein [Terriglobales bacterium]